MAELLKGRISDVEGLREALEIITTFKEVSQAVLDVRAPSVSGKIGVAWGRFITGALITGSDEKGKKALRQLLIVREGTFTFNALEPQPGIELIQALGLDLARTAAVVPELNYKEAHFLYDLDDLPTGTPVISPSLQTEYNVLEAWSIPQTHEEHSDTIDLTDRLSPIIRRTKPIEDLSDSIFTEPPLVDVSESLLQPVIELSIEPAAIAEAVAPAPALYVDLRPLMQLQSAEIDNGDSTAQSVESLTGPTAAPNTLLDSIFSAHFSSGPIEPAIAAEPVSDPPTAIVSKPKPSSPLLRVDDAELAQTIAPDESGPPVPVKPAPGNNKILIAIFVVSCAGTVFSSFGPQLLAMIKSLLHLQQ